jgi:hypothetical protein
MPLSTLLVRHVRHALLALACIAPVGVSLAQTPPPDAADARTQRQMEREAGRQNQKIERIHVEDGNAKVDELRVGGQTQSITVTPKTNDARPYQVMPNDTESSRNQGQPDSSSESGSRVWWNIFKF